MFSDSLWTVLTSLPPTHFLGSASGHKHVRNLLPEALGLKDGGQGKVQILQGK